MRLFPNEGPVRKPLEPEFNLAIHFSLSWDLGLIMPPESAHSNESILLILEM